ncbi:phage tail terminator protein [Pseudomonas mandelii]
MEITALVAHLRQRCPSYGGRIAGGIDFDAVANSEQLHRPSAYVISTGDQATKNDVQNGVRQEITDQFDVIVVLDTRDERGQQAVDLLHGLRKELWRALVGWKPTDEYEFIEYGGGELIVINRARVIYRYSFVAEFQLGRNSKDEPAETWHELELDGLPPFTGADFDMDCIDPADPNLQRPGPDGRIEAKFSGDVTP